MKLKKMMAIGLSIVTVGIGLMEFPVSSYASDTSKLLDKEINSQVQVLSDSEYAKTEEKVMFHIQARNSYDQSEELRLYFCEVSEEEWETAADKTTCLKKPATAICIEGMDDQRQVSIQIQENENVIEGRLKIVEEVQNNRIQMLYGSMEIPAKQTVKFDVSVSSDVPGNLTMIPVLKQEENFIYGTPKTVLLHQSECGQMMLNGYRQNRIAARQRVLQGSPIAPYDTRGEIQINLHDYDDRCLAVYNGANIPGIMHKKVIEEEGINKGRPFTFQYYMCDRKTGYDRWQNNYYMQPDTTVPKRYQKGIVAPLLEQGYPKLSDTTTAPGYSLSYLFNNTLNPGVLKNYEDVTGLFYRDDDGTYHFSNNEENIQLQADGTFQHQSGARDFLPLTNLTGQYKNFWFGMDMSLQFTIPENRKINGQDMIYQFQGDDDLWVFIDDVLVLDIGGIHSGLGGSINFTTGQVRESWIYTTRYGEADTDPAARVTGTLEHTIEESFAKAGRTWNNQQGTKHTMKIFYLERGYGGSQCSMSFKLPVVSTKKKTDITVSKEWKDNENQKQTRPDHVSVELYQNDTCIDTQTLSEKNHWTYTWRDLIYQEDTKTYTYDVKEKEVNGYSSEILKTGDHEKKWNYKLINTLKTGTLKIQKQSVLPELTRDNSCYCLQAAEYGVYREKTCENLVHTLITDQNGLATWEGIPVGIYYVKEIKASQGFELDPQIYPVNVQEMNTTVTINSKEKPGYEISLIQIKKTWTGEKTETIAGLEGTQFTIHYYDGYYREKELPIEATRTWVFEVKKNKDTGEYFAKLLPEYLIKTVSDPLYAGEDGKPCIPYGTISIQETKAAPGYTLEGTLSVLNGPVLGKTNEKVVLQVKKEAGVPKLEAGTSFTASDVPLKGKIQLKKKDGDGKTALQGAIFTLKEKNGKSIEEKITDANGEVLFENLYPNTYLVEEIKTAEGHTLLKEPLEIQVPMRFTEEQVKKEKIDTDRCIYDPEEKVYLVYDLTYEIVNHANFVIPMTGGKSTLGTYGSLIIGMMFMTAVVGILLKWRNASFR